MPATSATEPLADKEALARPIKGSVVEIFTRYPLPITDFLSGCSVRPATGSLARPIKFRYFLVLDYLFCILGYYLGVASGKPPSTGIVAPVVGVWRVTKNKTALATCLAVIFALSKLRL